MRSTLISFCRWLTTGLVGYLVFGLCLSCLNVMEQRLDLVGKENRLSHVRPPISIPLIGQNLSGVTLEPGHGNPLRGHQLPADHLRTEPHGQSPAQHRS